MQIETILPSLPGAWKSGRLATVLFAVVSMCWSLPSQAQLINTEFGKNRVQFHKDFAEWSQYQSDNFQVYWYGEARYVGQAVTQLAEQEFAAVQNILEHRMNDRIEIIVYVDLTDLKQSNIGSEEVFENQTGQTKIVGNKMFVYFNGDHNDLKRQVREGIASVFLNAMLFGSNLQEIVQNAVLLNLPPWFKDGLIGFCGESWNTELDNQLRDYVMSDEFESFEKFAEENPKLAGHSFWHFLSLNYGTSTVSNLLYLTRINRSIESGFLYVLGSSYEQITASWALFYRQRYLNESKEFFSNTGDQIVFKNKRDLPVTEIALSPDGKKLAYALNEIGKIKIYVQDLETGEREQLMKNGFRNVIQATDYEYPHLAWNPSGFQLGIIYERRDVIYLTIHDFTTDKDITEPLDPQYQRIHSADFVDNNTMVLSGTVRGLSDIFLYFTNTRQTQRITQDFWDDLDAVSVNLRGQRGIIFSSNRPDTNMYTRKLDSIVPQNDYDLYYFNLDGEKKELVRLTNTEFANERNPIAVDTTWYVYTSDESGIYNRSSGYLEDYIAYYEQVVRLKDGDSLLLHVDSSFASIDTALIDTVFTRAVVKTRGVNHFQTNYDRNIELISAAPRVDKMVELQILNNEYQLVSKSLNPAEKLTPKPTQYYINLISLERRKKSLESAISKAREEIKPTPIIEEPEPIYEPVYEPEPAVSQEESDTSKVDIDNYFFQTPFDEKEMPAKETQTVETPAEPEQNITRQRTIVQPSQYVLGKEPFRFKSSRIIPYRLKFRTDFVTTNLDNNILFDGLNSFAGTPQEFSQPPPGILMKANFKDLLEDYIIEGGVRIPTTFNGSEYFLFLDDKKNRWDKRYAFYRRGQRYIDDQSSVIPKRSEGLTNIALLQMRYPFDIYRSIRATGTFRMDRLTQLATDATTLNTPIFREQRIGLKLEYVFDNTIDVALNIKNGTRYKIYSEIVKRIQVNLGDDFQFDLGEGYMGVVGFDARHYQRFLKHSVLAVRGAGATSFGSEKILYYLGATENWIFPKFNTTIPIPSSDSYAYQTIAANLRGFEMNIRNGNSFAVFNTEVRIPIFRYIFPKTNSGFFKNFQAVGFFDAGTAWQGANPFSKENPLNTIYIPEGANPGEVPVTMKVNYFRDPIVAGYGFGARFLLFGYLIRMDYGWGIETREVQDPVLHISLGTDF
ncbi:MAG: PD40 domain-containing protein [Saprospiraceae bacterium]|nr:PD40 domain-containing protein [Saprospiraceae bacterium]